MAKKAILGKAIGDNTWDMKNGCKLTLQYRREGEMRAFTEYHDVIFFTHGEKVETAIKDLRNLANRLAKHCVEELE